MSQQTEHNTCKRYFFHLSSEETTIFNQNILRPVRYKENDASYQKFYSSSYNRLTNIRKQLLTKSTHFSSRLAKQL